MSEKKVKDNKKNFRKNFKGKLDKKEPDIKGKKNSSCDNDISWYSKYPNLVLPSSNPFFNKRYGAQVKNIFNVDANNALIIGRKTSIPGVIKYTFRPWIVGDGSEATAFNIAAKNFYTYIRHANSGATNYETSDLMQYLYCVAMLMVNFEQCKRILRLVPSFNAQNIYVFKTALHALGITEPMIQDIRNNLPNYVERVNVLAAQINTFKIPNDMSFIDRWTWLCSNVFRDDELDKASHYLFNCDSYAHYDWQNATIEVKHFTVATSFADLLTILENEVVNMLSYEDVGIMIGDILKAYGADKCRTVSPMAVGEILESSYSKEALTQFKNATLHSTIFFESKITQVASNTQLLQETMVNPVPAVIAASDIAPGKVVYCHDWYSNVKPTNPLSYEFRPVLTIDSNNPTNEEVIIQTRLSNFVTVKDSSLDGDYALFEITELGSEFITDAAIYFMTENPDGSTTETRLGISSLNFLPFEYNGANADNITSGDFMLVYAFIHRIITFKCTDIANFSVLEYSKNIDTAAESFREFNYFDGKNVITIDQQWLHDLNVGCKMSQMTIPMIKLLETK